MLTVDRDIETPPERVWDVLVDLDCWPKWGLSVRRGALDEPDEGLALGSTGRVWTPVGVALPFEITEFDPGTSWAWSVIGIPATRHTVAAVGGGTRLSFGVPWWAPAYLTVCAVALCRIEQLALNER
ncbi:MAG: hypothetical protein NVSMB60_09330 [Mycobacterium sp.]